MSHISRMARNVVALLFVGMMVFGSVACSAPDGGIKVTGSIEIGPRPKQPLKP